jgi:hypothetical protein
MLSPPISDDACIVVVEVCAVAATAGTHEGVAVGSKVGSTRARPADHRLARCHSLFEDNDSIQGQNESSVLLRNVVKPGDALRHARFVRLEEVGQCWGRARCHVRTLMRTRRVEWERRSCVAEVFEPYLGVLARHQVYSTLR